MNHYGLVGYPTMQHAHAPPPLHSNHQLQITQATISSSPHPLLSEQLLSIKSGVDEATMGGDNVSDNTERERDRERDIALAADEGDGDEDDEENVTSALGTLSVSERGEARFIGRVAAEVCLTLHLILDTTDLQSERRF